MKYRYLMRIHLLHFESLSIRMCPSGSYSRVILDKLMETVENSSLGQ